MGNSKRTLPPQAEVPREETHGHGEGKPTADQQMLRQQRSSAAIAKAQKLAAEDQAFKLELGRARDEVAALEKRKDARGDLKQAAEIGEAQALRQQLEWAKEDIALLEARNKVLELRVQKSQRAQRAMAARLEERAARSRGKGWERDE